MAPRPLTLITGGGSGWSGPTMSSSGSEAESCCLCFREALEVVGGDGATSQRFDRFPEADGL